MYGKIYGYYEGSTLVLSIADPDMAREILIKQFDIFQLRKVLFDNTKDPYAGMFITVGQKWKRVRGISSPTFSGKKMKMMLPLVQRSIEKLMRRFEDRSSKNEDFDISEDLKCLTLDVIASTVFSYDTDIFNTERNIFLQKLNQVFNNLNPEKMSPWRKLRIAILISFPSLQKLVSKFWPDFGGLPKEWFLELAKRMITERQSSGEVRPDYIQLMLNLLQNPQHESESEPQTDVDLSEDEMNGNVGKDKFLTMEEMQAQTFLFLAAGYETTATTLSWIVYYLSLYPDVQSKLQNEVDEYFPIHSQDNSYETVQKMSYLDMVFCEVSRLASIAQNAVQRMCNQTTKVGNVIVPKGAKVMINVSNIHRNTDLWGPEPVDQMVPERFTPERKGARHPMAYLPFGAGPRNCIGMRFAIMESKMALISLLQRYNVHRCNKTQVPVKCNRDGIHGPAEGVFVNLRKRT